LLARGGRNGYIGIVTAASRAGKIVGDLRDGYNREEGTMLKKPDGSFEFGGTMLPGAAERMLGAALPGQGAALGGCIFGLPGRHPQTGGRAGGGHGFAAARSKGFRVGRAKLAKKRGAENGNDGQ
jgi:hypothetical protein